MSYQAKLQFIHIWRLIIIFFAFGVSGYHFIESLSWIDSLYMTSIILSTVGFGGGLNELSELGRLFTVFLIIFGVGIVAYALTISGEYFFQNKLFRNRKMENKIKSLNQHFIVCGYGRMGKIICRELHKNKQPFIVVENNQNKIA